MPQVDRSTDHHTYRCYRRGPDGFRGLSVCEPGAHPEPTLSGRGSQLAMTGYPGGNRGHRLWSPAPRDLTHGRAGTGRNGTIPDTRGGTPSSRGREVLQAHRRSLPFMAFRRNAAGRALMNRLWIPDPPRIRKVDNLRRSPFTQFDTYRVEAVVDRLNLTFVADSLLTEPPLSDPDRKSVV